MKNTALVAGLVLTAIGWALPVEAAEPVGYAIGVDIAPDPRFADAYEARAIVTDLATEEVLSAPRIRFRRGPAGKAKIQSGTPDGLSIHMEVEVDALGETATYTAEIRRDETVVSVHKVRVRLEGSGAAE